MNKNINKFYAEGIDPMFKYPKMPDDMPKTHEPPFNISDRNKPCVPVDEKVFKLTDSELETFNTQSNQYGHRSKTENISSTPQETPEYVKTVKTTRKPLSIKSVTEEQINESSKTFKYGEHYKSNPSMTTDLKLITRGVMDRVPVKNIRGPPRNSAGVNSGAIGEKVKGLM